MVSQILIESKQATQVKWKEKEKNSLKRYGVYKFLCYVSGKITTAKQKCYRNNNYS